MARQQLLYAALAILVVTQSRAEPTVAAKLCDSRIAAYAAAAFVHYKDGVNSGEIPGHAIVGQQIIDSVYWIEGASCRLPATGFEGFVDMAIVFLNQDDIIALGPNGRSPRYFKLFGFEEVDASKYDVGPGHYRIGIHNYEGIHHTTTDEGPGLAGAACSWIVWVVDEDGDGVVDYVRNPPGRNGVCS